MEDVDGSRVLTGFQVEEVVEDDALGPVGRLSFGPAASKHGGVLLMPRIIEHDTDQFAQIIEIYTPPGMEQKFAAAGAIAIADGNTSADADDDTRRPGFLTGSPRV